MTLRGYKFAIIEDSVDFALTVGWTIDGSPFLNAELDIYKEVSKFKDKGYDLIFTDLRLKETWGAETIRALKEKTKAPIVVLTGLGGPFMSASDMQLFKDAGAVEIFNKEAITDPAWPDMIKAIAEKGRAGGI